MMKKQVQVFLAAALATSAGLAAEFHVGVSGRDEADGSASSPFRTLTRAVKALRELRAAKPGEPVEIRLGAGFHELEETVALTAADTTAPVTVAGAGRDRTILSGGRRLTLGPQDGGRFWGVHLPEVQSGDWKIEQLYVNGRRALRPTLPRDGYYLVADKLPGKDGKGQLDRFKAAKGQFSADWPDLTNGIETVVMYYWNISRVRVKSYDPQTCNVVLEGGRPGWGRLLTKGVRFRIENVGDAFGEVPGEWHCNPRTGWLRYFPLPGEAPDRTEIVAPRLPALVTLLGAAGKPVSAVTVRDLTLAHQSEVLAPGGTSYTQTSPAAGGAVVVRYGKDIRLENVAVRQTGGWGVKFCEGCANCVLTKSLLHDIGAGGALVGLDRRAPVARGSAAWSHDCEISDCEVFGYGRVQPGGVGVNLLLAGDCRVLRNVIHDGYYSGINTGYEWRLGGNAATGNLIADNHVYDIGKEMMSDLAGIYTLGEHAGTVIAGNCIHDVTRSHYGAQGFYFDQGSSNIRVSSNVVYRTHDATYNVSAPNVRIRGDNNLFAFSSNYFLTSPAMRDRPKGGCSNWCERCVMLYDDGMKSRFPTDRGPMDDENSVYTNNVWIKSGLRQATPEEMMAAASTAEATALGFRPFALRVRQAEAGLPACAETFPPLLAKRGKPPAARSAAAVPALVPAPQKYVAGEGALVVTAKAVDASLVAFSRDASIPAEGYVLDVTAKGVAVRSSDEAGAFYAVETLKQMAERKAELKGMGKNVYGIPCATVTDAPAFAWRGLLLDESRHFFGKEVVKRTLDQMAMHKLNVLHWHLTDDQGWRLEIPKYPELVKYGAVRPASVRHGVQKFGRRHDLNDERYGPFYYTAADVREILAYAAERHISIMPEIELPGHAYAALAAYPEFACVPENLKARRPRLQWSIEKDVLCVGNPAGIRFFEDVLDYVCELFPSKVIHIGGDETPRVRWKDCPKCRAFMKEHGIGDVEGIQPWVTRHFADYLAKKGRRIIGWDEILAGDVPQDALGMSWRATRRGAISGATGALRGHDMVMTPSSHCYIDYGQGLEDDPYEYIGGRLPLSVVYTLDPYEGVPAEARKHILGGQGNNWSEYTWSRFDLEWKMWPRACALAEVFWTYPALPRDYRSFESRMEIHRRRLLRAGINCAPLR